MTTILNHKTTYHMARNLIIGIFLITLTAILININIAQNAYAIETLTQTNHELDMTVHQKQIENEKLASPQTLSQKAEALGMVTADVYNFHMLQVTK